jgi:NAD(P)H-flavin reductase
MVYIACDIQKKSLINEEFFILEFNWDKPAPKAGQFFMMKPSLSAVFLQRPISIFEYNPVQKTLKFLIAIRGKGTKELSQLQKGDNVILTGPLGNAWADFLPESGKAALVGGSVGIAPLAALVAEKHNVNFHIYFGIKQGFKEKEQEITMLGNGINAEKIIVTAEDGKNAALGRIIDILEPQDYDIVFGCGPTAMLQALRKKCIDNNKQCYISLEARFACGVGACLGCSIKTINGNRCSCKDGTIFNAQEIIFDE